MSGGDSIGPLNQNLAWKAKFGNEVRSRIPQPIGVLRGYRQDNPSGDHELLLHETVAADYKRSIVSKHSTRARLQDLNHNMLRGVRNTMTSTSNSIDVNCKRSITAIHSICGVSVTSGSSGLDQNCLDLTSLRER
ncbi:uncharacterized protein MELLADRAFT_102155 [Melampsora larici-populina 98AG31]|uniref:Uncharacterized protein n=1 Tax=Melampsora larici-populina (strain 98AG31 / pathotype 3-4-7) TaxID=747676 RepID=F4R7D5_MELLP|nr:uncharacterized protein MELLADRAFT_102155 [Melampsora larici-populina 98AG31]EGG11296.1 hypothetical protein MELLADRAFT_102155 [Melampsora larici-populina 98AG31]